MTSQDAFFTREEYFQLLYGALREDDCYDTSRLVTLPPTIWKPAPLWTGKQIVSDSGPVLRSLTLPRYRQSSKTSLLIISLA